MTQSINVHAMVTHFKSINLFLEEVESGCLEGVEVGDLEAGVHDLEVEVDCLFGANT